MYVVKSSHKNNIIQAYHPVASLTNKFRKQFIQQYPKIIESTSNSTRETKYRISNASPVAV